MTPSRNAAEPAQVVQIADQLQKQAAQTTDPRLKRLLLAAGCEIIDAALNLHRPPAAA
jgi:hypothetical protein